MNKWLEVKNSGDVGELYIYGEITDLKWFDEDVTPQSVKDELDKLDKAKSVNIYVNSPGGNVFAGVAIYNTIKRLNKPTKAYIDGMAASIASLIILAADEVVMPINAMIMIHNPWMISGGDANEFREMADRLDKISDSTILTTYMDKTGIEKEELKAMMDKETWLSAEESKSLGFADTIEKEQKVSACYKGDNIEFNKTEIVLDKFKSFPRSKFEEHKEVNNTNTLKQRHKHVLNMLLA